MGAGSPQEREVQEERHGLSPQFRPKQGMNTYCSGKAANRVGLGVEDKHLAVHWLSCGSLAKPRGDHMLWKGRGSLGPSQRWRMRLSLPTPGLLSLTDAKDWLAARILLTGCLYYIIP